MLRSRVVVSLVALIAAGLAPADDEIYASDPTRIYTFLGGGLKYSDYTNNESMTELRLTGNWGIDYNDAVLFEVGYGWHDGDAVPGADSGVTNLRVRYFHLLPIDYDLVRGYRGMGLQFDLRFAGELKGTDGQNVLSAGAMPSFGLAPDWNLYLTAGVVGAWDKSFAKFNGAGVSVSPKFVYSPETLWPGAQFQLTPTYQYFMTGALQGDGSGEVEINIGGEFTPTIMWDLVGEVNFDKDLKTLRRGRDTGLENDWNVFFNVTTYF